MTSPPSVLIAGLSGRALASSARRAGFVPLVVDAFGDEDTRDAAFDLRVRPSAFKRGFRARTLLEALRELTDVAPAPSIGLILGSGFENRPALVATLARRFHLLGCTSDAVRACKDPFQLAGALSECAIPTPPVAKTIPIETSSTWLRKHIGGTGGGHISYASPGDPATTKSYVQSYVEGRTVSALCLTNATQSSCHVVGFSEQWCAPTSLQPFRYGGAVGPIELSDVVANAIIASAQKLSDVFRLQGLISIDFILTDDKVPYLIEVNPRPSATLDVFETPHGALFKAHVAECLGEPTPRMNSVREQTAQATAYLYADHGTATIGDFNWPSWTADRPAPGTKIQNFSPIATIFAQAATPGAAKTLCQTRLGQLGDMVYCDQKTEAPPE